MESKEQVANVLDSRSISHEFHVVGQQMKAKQNVPDAEGCCPFQQPLRSSPWEQRWAHVAQ